MKARPQLLTLEPLEDRSLLSTCTVMNLLDVGRGGMSIGSGQVFGDLRFCINQANAIPGPDVIDFLVNGTIQLRRPLPDLASDIDIQGPGPLSLKVRRAAANDFRIFTVAAGTVQITGLTIENGRANVGGGIYNQASLTLNDVVVTANSSFGAQGGGIYNGGSLAISNSDITGNQALGGASNFGGGLYNSDFGIVTISSATIVNNSSGSGGGINNAGTLMLDDVTVASNTAGNGGGVFNKGPLLQIFSSTITGNDGTNGGGIHNAGMLVVESTRVTHNEGTNGGGIHNAGMLVVESTRVTDNEARGTSPAGEAHGGGINNAITGTATITFSTISNNTSELGHVYGGGISNRGSLTIAFSTVANNLAHTEEFGLADGSAYGGGIYNRKILSIDSCAIFQNTVSTAGWQDISVDVAGGGVATDWGSNTTIVNSTIANNLALNSTDVEYAVSSGGGVRNRGILTFLNSTVSGNSVTGSTGGAYAYGGGVSTASSVAESELHMHNTIISGNAAIGENSGAPDFGGSLESSGYNLIRDSSDGTGYAPTDILDVDPLLGPLQNNGGPTLTHALLPGSPAVDAGENADAPEFDQRGPGFERIVNGTIDIGAFEVQATGAPTGPNFLAFLITADLDHEGSEIVP